MNRALNIVIFILMVAILWYGVLIYQGLQDRARFQEEDKAKRITRMKYHGTDHTYEYRGKWYFDRKGRRCKL